ncbi:MAG: hypothetical protein K2Q03_06895 [Sphingobacteriaceae bacterium]|nr:hypothetical protein [Sphingobacteriaceae bacterium]
MKPKRLTFEQALEEFAPLSENQMRATVGGTFEYIDGNDSSSYEFPERRHYSINNYSSDSYWQNPFWSSGGGGGGGGGGYTPNNSYSYNSANDYYEGNLNEVTIVGHKSGGYSGYDAFQTMMGALGYTNDIAKSSAEFAKLGEFAKVFGKAGYGFTAFDVGGNIKEMIDNGYNHEDFAQIILAGGLLLLAPEVAAVGSTFAFGWSVYEQIR